MWSDSKNIILRLQSSKILRPKDAKTEYGFPFIAKTCFNNVINMILQNFSYRNLDRDDEICFTRL